MNEKPIALVTLRFRAQLQSGAIEQTIDLPVVHSMDASELKILWDFERFVNTYTTRRLHMEMHDA